VDWDDAKADSYDGDRLTGKLWLAAPGIVVTRVSGYGEIAAIQWYTRRMDRQLSNGRPLKVFHHWTKLTGFEPEARNLLRTWASQRGDKIVEAHYLVSSKITAMAIAAAALALRRKLVPHTNEAKFLTILDRAVAQAAADESSRISNR
jgi:hypothetical protein